MVLDAVVPRIQCGQVACRLQAYEWVLEYRIRFSLWSARRLVYLTAGFDLPFRSSTGLQQKHAHTRCTYVFRQPPDVALDVICNFSPELRRCIRRYASQRVCQRAQSDARYAVYQLLDLRNVLSSTNVLKWGKKGVPDRSSPVTRSTHLDAVRYRAFPVAGSLWNSLPDDFTSASTHAIFYKRLFHRSYTEWAIKTDPSDYAVYTCLAA